MSSWFTNDAQSRYSAIEGALCVYRRIEKTDYFIYGCPDLYIGVDHKPFLAFLIDDNPKPLDQISNKRLRKYITEINALKFKAFNISGAKNYLSDYGSRQPTGVAGGDKCGSNESVTTPPPPPSPPSPPLPLNGAGTTVSIYNIMLLAISQILLLNILTNKKILEILICHKIPKHSSTFERSCLIKILRATNF